MSVHHTSKISLLLIGALMLPGCAAYSTSGTTAEVEVMQQLKPRNPASPAPIARQSATTSASASTASKVTSTTNATTEPLEQIIINRRTGSPGEVTDAEISLETTNPVLIKVDE